MKHGHSGMTDNRRRALNETQMQSTANLLSFCCCVSLCFSSVTDLYPFPFIPKNARNGWDSNESIIPLHVMSYLYQFQCDHQHTSVYFCYFSRVNNGIPCRAYKVPNNFWCRNILCCCTCFLTQNIGMSLNGIEIYLLNSIILSSIQVIVAKLRSSQQQPQKHPLERHWSMS